MSKMLLSVVGLLSTLSLVHAAPQIQLGRTSLTGRDITGFKLDFFGGMYLTTLIRPHI